MDVSQQKEGQLSVRVCIRVRIRSSSTPFFSRIRTEYEIYSANLRIQSEWWKIRTRKAPNTDTFYAEID